MPRGWKNRSLGLILASTVLAGTIIASGEDARAATEDRINRAGLQIVAPAGWRLTTQTGYPEQLVRLSRAASTEQATIYIATHKNFGSDRTALRSYVADNIDGLKEIGLTPTSVVAASQQLFRVEFALERGRTLRQVYLDHRGMFLIVTLVAPTANIRRYSADARALMRSLGLPADDPPYRFSN